MRIIKRVIVGCAVVALTAVIAALAIRKLVPTTGTEDDDTFSLVAAGTGTDFQSRAARLREGQALAVMGGIELDLVDADIDQGATLDVTAIMGGVDVIVPATWRVEVRSTSFLGGVGNLTNPDLADDDAPLLLVQAKAIIGGIEIHATEEV